MSSEIQYCLFPNLDIFRNMKPINGFDIPSLETHMDWESLTQKKNRFFCSYLYVLSKTWANSMFFINIICQKFDPKEELIFYIYIFLTDIFRWITWLWTTWWYGKNFDILQLIVFDIMKILSAPSYFSTYSEIWSPPNFPLHNRFKSYTASQMAVV